MENGDRGQEHDTDDPAARRYRGFTVMLASQPPESADNPIGIPAGLVLQLVTAPEPPTGYMYEPSVIYGRAGRGGRLLHLRLYRPVDSSEARPAVVCIHGGAWQAGFPELQIRHAHALAGEGYVTATISYRLAGEATWPAALEDAKCAVRWMRANAAALGVDRDRIAVLGESSGGHLAAMVALTPGRFEGSGGHHAQLSAVAAAVLLCPVTDLREEALTARSGPPVASFLGPDAGLQSRLDASPINYLNSQCPPTLVLAGALDDVVPPTIIRRYQGLLEDTGVANRVKIYEGYGHPFSFELWEETMQEISAFLHEQLTSDGATARQP